MSNSRKTSKSNLKVKINFLFGAVVAVVFVLLATIAGLSQKDNALTSASASVSDFLNIKEYPTFVSSPFSSTPKNVVAFSPENKNFVYSQVDYFADDPTPNGRYKLSINVDGVNQTKQRLLGPIYIKTPETYSTFVNNNSLYLIVKSSLGNNGSYYKIENFLSKTPKAITLAENVPSLAQLFDNRIKDNFVVDEKDNIIYVKESNNNPAEYEIIKITPD